MWGAGVVDPPPVICAWHSASRLKLGLQSIVKYQIAHIQSVSPVERVSEDKHARWHRKCTSFFCVCIP